MVLATYFGICLNYDDILMLVRGCEEGMLNYIQPTLFGGKWYEESIRSGEVFVMLTNTNDRNKWEPNTDEWRLIDTNPVFESRSFFCKSNKHPMSGMIRRVSRPFDLQDGKRRVIVLSYYRLRDYETHFLPRAIQNQFLHYTFVNYKPYVGSLSAGPEYDPSDKIILPKAARDEYYNREVIDNTIIPPLGQPVFFSRHNQEYHKYRTDLIDVVKPPPDSLPFPTLVVPDLPFPLLRANLKPHRAPALKEMDSSSSTESLASTTASPETT